MDVFLWLMIGELIEEIEVETGLPDSANEIDDEDGGYFR